MDKDSLANYSQARAGAHLTKWKHSTWSAQRQGPLNGRKDGNSVTTARTKRGADSQLQKLPLEILIKILSYLDAAALFRISHVNKLFCRLANDNALWSMMYIFEFKQWKSTCIVEPLQMRLQDRASGYWKRLFFEAVVQRDTNKLKKNLRYIDRYTGLPSRTEQLLRNLHVAWELMVSDESGDEFTLELIRSEFCGTSVCLSWSGGGRLPSYQHISTLQLHGVSKMTHGCSHLKNPGGRSLMSKVDMQALTQSAQVIGRDRLVELKLLQPGILIGTWKDQRTVAFIMFTLHFHRLVERSVQGSSFCPRMAPVVRPASDDIDPEYGLHGYQLHIVLHDTVCELMSESFYQLSCPRSQIRDGLIQLTAISGAGSHIPLSGRLTLPWRCEALQGSAENCCIMSLTLLDEFRNPFWCVTSPVSVELEKTQSGSFDYDGERFPIHHVEKDGQVEMTLAWAKEQKQFVIVSLIVCVSVSKVNKHFSRDY
ncbi:F-box only protein 15 [Platichthys flesus]|uniref:F-box only protein 15 n=1 Tax=Platichthys flesus TaxID=8260 RepID=UPI002DB5C456|nr:F-box only protein 15 [Platichthys flesus]